MLLACVLFALFTVGFVVPCMIDVATAPDWEFHVMSRRTWLFVIAAFWVLGAAAWLLMGRPRQHSRMPLGASGAPAIGPAEALRRHPAGQAMELSHGGQPDWPGSDTESRSVPPRGPDDDPGFLLELERRIREAREEQ